MIISYSIDHHVDINRIQIITPQYKHEHNYFIDPARSSTLF